MNGRAALETLVRIVAARHNVKINANIKERMNENHE